MADYHSIKLTQKLITRLFSNIKISTTNFYNNEPCWEWQKARTDQRYCQITIKSIPYYVHRVMYFLFVEPIDPSLQCDHLCRVRHCINPVHLDAVTPRTNYLRGESAAAQNARRTHCKNGHPFAVHGKMFLRSGTQRFKRICMICKKAWHQNRRANRTPEQILVERQKGTVNARLRRERNPKPQKRRDCADQLSHLPYPPTHSLSD